MSTEEQPYKLAVDIYRQNPLFFKKKGLTNIRSINNCLDIFNIAETNFIFQKKTKSGYVTCGQDDRGAKLFLTQQWIEENICGIAIKKQQNRERITQTIAHLKKQITPLSGIYLFSLGHVKDLRTQFTIPASFQDDWIVCKFGKSDKIDERANQHLATYGMMDYVEMDLECYIPVDEQLITDAENATKQWFITKKYKIPNTNYIELVAFPQSFLPNVIKFYERNCNKHGKELQNNVVEIKNLKIQLETMKKAKTEHLLQQYKKETDSKLEQMMGMLEAMMGKLMNYKLYLRTSNNCIKIKQYFLQNINFNLKLLNFCA